MEQQYHERLRKYRENAHLTQEEPAERIEVSRQTVSNLNTNKATYSRNMILRYYIFN